MLKRTLALTAGLALSFSALMAQAGKPPSRGNDEGN